MYAGLKGNMYVFPDRCITIPILSNLLRALGQLTAFDWLSLGASLASLCLRYKLRAHFHFSSSEACILATAVNLILLILLKLMYFLFDRDY